ncbi:phage tail tip lysozyme [Anaeromicropila populeti]|uniref:Phage tail lysozyme domain-containing protein n=1 Tax=Anaeromicropila populeti TaxID=37658 RepID=A0A1I6JG82_9FIRM|nr:phage tail tip lysozyme [Anaeromicropila populeti]SFR77894.1 hypothetical protein SAMN05661086_01653 [Anaeromicropila populeti]
MELATAVKIAKIAAEQLKSEEKRHRIFIIAVSLVILVLFLFSSVIYLAMHPLESMSNMLKEQLAGVNDTICVQEDDVLIKKYPDIEQTIWQFLKGLGFTDEGAAATMGNMVVESSFNPAANHNDHYFGLCQWGGGRWQGNDFSLTGFSQKCEKEWSDLQVQLTFFYMECSTYYANVYLLMGKTKDVVYATDYFCTYYEGCVGSSGNWAYSTVNGKAYQGLANRRRYAEWYLKKYGLGGG